MIIMINLNLLWVFPYFFFSFLGFLGSLNFTSWGHLHLKWYQFWNYFCQCQPVRSHSQTLPFTSLHVSLHKNPKSFLKFWPWKGQWGTHVPKQVHIPIHLQVKDDYETIPSSCFYFSLFIFWLCFWVLLWHLFHFPFNSHPLTLLSSPPPQKAKISPYTKRITNKIKIEFFY